MIKMNMDAQIKDADVIISDAAGRFAHILWNDKIGQYVLEKNRFPINTGKIYYLLMLRSRLKIYFL